MLTFLHAADIHLDSPLRGLLHYEGASPIEDISGATRQAIEATWAVLKWLKAKVRS